MQWAAWYTDTTSDPVEWRPVRPEWVMVTSCMTSEVTARSLEKGPRAGQRALSARPWRTRVARKLEMETLLVEEARNNRLQDGAAGRAVASL
jgi:hypothetical protein